MRVSVPLGPIGHEFENIRLVPEFKVVSFAHTELDANGKFAVPIEPGTIVLAVGLEATTAFTGASAVIVGDADDDDGWIKTGLLDLTSAGAVYFSPGGTGDLRVGKLYAALNQIIVDTTGTISAGTGKLFIQMITTAGNWRQPAL